MGANQSFSNYINDIIKEGRINFFSEKFWGLNLTHEICKIYYMNSYPTYISVLTTIFQKFLINIRLIVLSNYKTTVIRLPS